MADSGGDLDLAPIGNSSVSALIDRSGRFVWACAPRFDSDPLFSSLLSDRDPADDEAQGLWAIDLVDLAETRQEYLRNTAILRTELVDANGAALEIIDFCPRYSQYGRIYRPTAFIRIVRPLAGAPNIRIRLKPTADWGARLAEQTSGSNHLRFLCADLTLRLTTNCPVSHIVSGRTFRLEQTLAFFLGPDEGVEANVLTTCERMLGETTNNWREWVRTLSVPLEWQAVVIRAAIALKLCAYEETGAIVAAMTTSIPEAPHSGRNWDYRFCWLRDAYYVVQALNRLGAADILENYLRYLRNLIDQSKGGHIQPVYGVGLEPALSERTIDALPGFRGMGPVRVGNQAHEHLQHDVYGQIILSAAQAFFDERLLRPATVEDFEALEKVGERAFLLHAEPDAGLWEFRTMARVHTYSAVMCWAACDRLSNVAGALGLPGRVTYWRERAQTIRQRIETDAWNAEKDRFAGSFGGEELDASLLQLVDVRFLAPDDPRNAKTFAAVEEELKRGPYLMRYVADDFGAPETAFNVCTFWFIEALHLSGRTAEARALFEQMLSHRTSAGLLSEDIGLEDGRLWGNYPQTYSLVEIINCAALLFQALELGALSRLIVISNRISRPAGRGQAQTGGLAMALTAGLRAGDGLWFGWSGKTIAAFTGEITTTRHDGIEVATVDLEDEDIQQYYNGYANKTLWPLFHYRLDLAAYDRSFAEGYDRVNRRLAQTIRPLIGPDDTVWVHDYHLIPMARELRALGVKCRIGFFLHTPWPARQLVVTLPRHRRLVEALFDYDLIGFQTTEWLDAFEDYLVHEVDGQVMGDGRLVAFGKSARAGAFPIGIDTEEFIAQVHSATATRMYDRMAAQAVFRTMMVGVDRLDYSKGLDDRFMGFELFLHDNPDFAGQVFLLQIAPLSRDEVDTYQDIRTRLDTLSGRINAAYAEADFAPIRYVNRNYRRDELAGVYRAAKVGLVTPLRDGMNLVAKEYVAAQNPDDPGVLILSRFAGAALQMREALIVNPFSHEELSEAIKRALTMDLPERKRRFEALFEGVKRNDVTAWRESFVAALEATRA